MGNDLTDPYDTSTLNADQAPSKNNAKLITFILAIVLPAIVFGVGGYCLGAKSVGLNKNTNIGTTNELSNIGISTPPTLNSDLVTYLDEYYQFSFQYPKDWKLNCSTPQNDNWLDANICDITAPDTYIDHGGLRSGAYFVIGASKPNSIYSTFQEKIQYSVNTHQYEANPKVINNIQGYEMIAPSQRTFTFESKGHFISVGGLPTEPNEPYFDDIQKIMSSFKFTNNTSSE